MASQYHSIDEEKLLSDRRSHKKSDKKWLRRIAIHVLCLLWLLPINTLLYANFRRRIIGPSVWCPLGKCSVNDKDGYYSPERVSRNDRGDHNINGMLLFAAKALEVWFTAVAGLLVYEAQSVLRRSNGGLPDDYSLTYLEFSDLLNILKISKWTRPIRDARHSAKVRRGVLKFCAFVLLAFVMTILVNLMGPATGVLVLPTVQSISQQRHASEHLLQMRSHFPPANGSGFLGCNPEEIENHRYSCAKYVQAPELDSMIMFEAAPIRKAEITDDLYRFRFHLAESQEDNVAFLAFNFTPASKTDKGNNFTVPNRQALRLLSEDIDHLNNVSGDTTGDDLVGKSLQLSTQREGPAILVSSLNIYDGLTYSIPLSDNKNVTCLQGWTSADEDDDSVYTKCIRDGTEWNGTNRKERFSIGNSGASSDTGAKTEVVVYFTDKTTYFGGKLNRDEHAVACLNRTVSADCDWEGIFSDPLPINGSMNSTTIVEWFFPNATDGGDHRVWFEFGSSLQYSVYSADISFGSGIYMAQVDDSKPGPELVIDPLWMLGAWSVDVNGTVNSTRFPAMMLHELSQGPQTWTDGEWVEFSSINLFAMAQAMSLISYDSVPLNGTAGHDRNDLRYFDQWVTRRVWAWGLSSRTSILGVVVTCAGMVTVIFRCVFALYYCRDTEVS